MNALALCGVLQMFAAYIYLYATYIYIYYIYIYIYIYVIYVIYTLYIYIFMFVFIVCMYIHCQQRKDDQWLMIFHIITTFEFIFSLF